MPFKTKSNLSVEVALRITLWILELFLDNIEPFHRLIKEDDLWKYQYPNRAPTCPSSVLYLIIIITPTILFAFEFMQTNKIEDLLDGTLAVTLSHTLTGVATTFLKVIVGRPRPDFYFRCFPDGTGDDFEACAGPKSHVMEGRKSFPSGHASFSFSCMTFISLYLGRKLHLFRENRRRQSWQFCICLFPIFVAAGIAVSRICDYRHHTEDVIVGSLIGTVFAYSSFKLYFPDTSYATDP